MPQQRGPQDIDTILARTFDDRRLTRSERRALQAVVAELEPGPEERSALLGRAFDVASRAMPGRAERKVLEWLLTVTRVLATPPAAPRSETLEVVFGPLQDCNARLRALIDATRSSLAICVFTLTDDRLAHAVLRAHGRGVAVRLIADDLKAEDLGSDVMRLRQAGIAVRFDCNPDHMHHKFALFDHRLAATGSYNWTRGAAERNHENVLISDDPRLIAAYSDEFERLWQAFPAEPPASDLVHR